MARILADARLTVGEITQVLGLPQSTVSRHLKTLRTTGLLSERREGNRTYIGLVEPGSNGRGNLAQVLNTWLRQQPLSRAVESRLRQTVLSRTAGTDAFERLAHQWDGLRFEYFGPTFHLEAMAALLPEEWRVLDAGTGTGHMLPFLSRQFREVVAADSSAAMLELARQRGERHGLDNVRFRLGRLEDLPLEDQSIDCALSVLVLRHSPDLGASLAELARVVVTGGRLLIVDIGPHRMEDFRRRIGDASNGLDPETVALGLKHVGFRVLRQRQQPLPAPDSPATPTRLAPDLFLIAAVKET